VGDLQALQRWMLAAILTKDLSGSHVTGRLDIYTRAYEIRTLRHALAVLEKAR
jgi:hypothetical protein